MKNVEKTINFYFNQRIQIDERMVMKMNIILRKCFEQVSEVGDRKRKVTNYERSPKQLDL